MTTLYHILGTPFGWIMRIIYDVVQNYGVAIILFTLFTKIILFPITYKQMKNSSKMQLLNPKIEKLRKSYKNNPQKLQEEQMKLYAEEGVNMGGSCLPMILQFVILFGVLDVVYRPLAHIMKISSSVVTAAAKALETAGMFKGAGLREELYILSASVSEKYSGVIAEIEGLDTDLLVDFYNKFQLFGIHLGEQPSIHPDKWTGEAVALVFIPIIAGALQLVLTIFSQIQQKRSNPDMPQMKSMNIMMYIMPVFSVFFAFSVPAGVGFYWICSSFFSLIQTIVLNIFFTKERMLKIAEKEREKNKKKRASGKKSFMQMMLDAQSEQSQQLERHKNESEEERSGMSKKELNLYNRQILAEKRKNFAEKYGDEYIDDDQEAAVDDEKNEILELARKRMAEKYKD